MRAVTYDRYTTPAGLALTDEPTPEPGEGQVLIRVEAAALNAYDWHMYRGDPAFMRLTTGLRVKERRTVGADLAGTVEAVGAGVSRLTVGDRVMGEVPGALADFAVARAGTLARIPDGVDSATAAATPMAGLTALQALRDKAALAEGERVLVWGASGGVGHLAVQVAKALGASVVDAVCSGRNAAMVRACGADAVADYTADEFPTGTYDVVIDTVATAPMRRLKTLVAPGGRVVVVGAVGGGKLLGPAAGLARRIIAGKLSGVSVSTILAHPNDADLALLAGWLADGTLAPVIAQEYPLAEFREALARLEDGHVGGKLVVRVAD